MSRAINLLVAEDSQDDASIVIRILERGGFEARYERVETAAAMEAALRHQAWDAVISDYNMPGFNGLDALRILRSTGLDIPFILISGTVGEEIAVDALRAGAADYVLKKNLSRLPLVLERELREAAIRAEHRQVQRDLVESEARFRSLAEMSSDGYWEQDEQYRFTGMWGGALGAKDETIGASLGKARWELPRNRPVEGDWSAHRSTLDARQPFRDFIYERMLPNGSIMLVAVSGFPIFHADGRFKGYRGTATDVTERKRAEEALRRFRVALDNSADMILLIDRTTMRYVDVNETVCRLLGYSREEMTGMGPQDVLPASREEFERAYDALIANPSIAESMRTYYRCKDGSTLPFESTRHVLRSGDGYLIVAISRDIRERLTAEQNLRESEARFRSLTELSSDWYWEQDEQYRFVSVGVDSGGKLYVRAAEFVGKMRWDNSTSNLGEAEWAVHRAVLDARQPFTDFEFSRLSADGERRWVSISGAPILDAEGRFKGYRGVGTDITKRKQAEDKIRRLNRVYAMLSGINSAIVRIRDRAELFQETCRIVVEAGRLALAYICVVEPAEQRLKPVASAGADADFLEGMQERMSLRDGEPEGYGPSATAVRERRAVVVNDTESDSRIRHRKAHAERGIRSVAVLPLFVSGEPVAVLGLYAAEIGFFDEEEIRLLTELAGDIGFALDHIEKANRLDYLAYYDQLTGLANRRLFLERLNQTMHAASLAGDKVALVLIDVERLTTVNESLGRQAGDTLLVLLAERLARSAGPGELARIGADVFAIIQLAVKGKSEVTRRIEKVWDDCFGKSFRLGDSDIRISAKAGAAMFPRDGAGAETLLRNAEAALRRAKKTGERHVFHALEMTAKTAEKLTLENRLRQALEKEEFVLYYQPKVDLETRRIVGAEALIRWQSPELGLVPPGQFIALMEETGLILDVGAWALSKAVADHAQWIEQGVPPPRVAVNVSAIQLRRRDFLATLEGALERGAAPPGIDLEITESLVMEDIQGNIEKLRAVRDLGVNIAIDDFGTGYSSLGYLARLPVQSLKIDRSFIITMLKESDTMTLVSTIISLAHSLRLKVVAEGVDAEEQAKMLRLLRCDEMQGYLFSRPIPFDRMTALLTQGAKGL